MKGVQYSLKLPSIRLFAGLCLLAVPSSAQETAYSFSIEQLKDRLVMTIHTDEPLPCIGSSIRNRVVWDADTMTVLLSGFIRPTPCLQGLDPASVRIDLGRDTSTVRYLRIQEGAFTDLWKILCEGGGVRVSSIKKSFTSYSN